MQRMKLLQAPNLKTRALTKAMYAAIRRYVDEAFDNMIEESEKILECFMDKKLLRPVPNQGIVEQAKNNGELRPKRGRTEVTEDAP